MENRAVNLYLEYETEMRSKDVWRRYEYSQIHMKGIYNETKDMLSEYQRTICSENDEYHLVNPDYRRINTVLEPMKTDFEMLTEKIATSDLFSKEEVDVIARALENEFENILNKAVKCVVQYKDLAYQIEQNKIGEIEEPTKD